MNKLVISLLLAISVATAQTDSYSNDDSHNHDGSHPSGPKNCGSNYMLPGETARLGSHSFLILGQDGDNHIIADHRSGTPPHNYHFILRVKLDEKEMAFYKKLLSESDLTPAFTTIYYDDNDSKKQLDRTFFCLTDLPKIFGDKKKKGDEFEKLFPIRASLQKDADFEGAFEIEKSIYPGGHLTIERDDVELIVYRYLPSYLEQQAFRKAIKTKPKEVVPLLFHAPSFATDTVSEASKKVKYASTDGNQTDIGSCPKDFYAKKSMVPKTTHSFLLLSEIDKNAVLGVHYYDQAPHNFQTAMRIKLSDDEMKVYRLAKEKSSVPPFFQTSPDKGSSNYFCMADIKKLIKENSFVMKGSVYKNTSLNEYKIGTSVGKIEIEGRDIEIITNRNLLSLMNPIAIAKEVLGKDFDAAVKK